MSIIGEKLDFSNAGVVLLKVGDQFTRTDFPDSDIAFHAARADEFTV